MQTPIGLKKGGLRDCSPASLFPEAQLAYKTMMEFFLEDPYKNEVWLAGQQIWKMAKETQICGMLFEYLKEVHDKTATRKNCHAKLKEATALKLVLPKALVDRAQRAIQMEL